MIVGARQGGLNISDTAEKQHPKNKKHPEGSSSVCKWESEEKSQTGQS